MTSRQLAVRQLTRNPLQTLLMTGGVLAAAAAMTAVALLISGTNRSIQRTVSRLGADLMVVPKGEDTAEKFNEALLSGKPAMFYLRPEDVLQVGRTDGVSKWSPQTFVETLDNARCCAGKFFVVGLDTQTDFTVSPWLGSGSIPRPGAPGNQMVVGDRILLREGDTATFYGMTFRVAGVLEPTGTGMDWTIYIPRDRFAEMIANSKDDADRVLRIQDGAASAVFVKAEAGVDALDLAERIEQNQPAVQVILASSVARAAGGNFAGIAGVLCGVVVALWGLALVLSGVLFTQAVREQQSELGLLMAKGAEKHFVFKLIACESLAIACVGGFIGCIVGAIAIVALGEALAGMLGVSSVLPSIPAAVAMGAGLVALVVLSTTIASLAPARRILQAEPYEALRGGVLA